MDPWVEEGDNPVAEIRTIAQEHGVLVGSGRPDVQIIIAPPLCVDENDIVKAIDVLDDAISVVFD